jgi:branched-chain amino acid aminotransferase
MWAMKITLSSHRKNKPHDSQLGFGQFFTDHMYLLDFDLQNHWHNPRIIPYQPIALDPAASVLHYGQALFEGMKAFRQDSGRVVMFRPDFNFERLQDGAERLCMQAPPPKLVTEGISELIRIDQDWVPKSEGCSLYIRPTLIGVEPFLGVRPSNKYLFYTILSPVGSYYAEGINPVKIWIEEEYIRAAPGGLGATKAAANYASSLKAAVEAKKKGFAQVLWTDAREHAYFEEVGTMNVFFRMGSKIVTPKLNGSILGGGVRDSVLKLLRKWDYSVEERPVSVAEVMNSIERGNLLEVFGTGTAAVISPVGEFGFRNQKIPINGGKMGELSQRLYKHISDIQRGRVEDEFNWVMPL